MSQHKGLADGQNRSDLPALFKRIHYYLYANSNILRSEKLGAEMTKLLFCKIFDEKSHSNGGFFRDFSSQNAEAAAKGIRELFDEVKNGFPDVFEEDEKLHLDDKSLHYVVTQLHGHVLSGAQRDVIGEAFQSFWGARIKRREGAVLHAQKRRGALRQRPQSGPAGDDNRSRMWVGWISRRMFAASRSRSLRRAYFRNRQRA